jgi:hypothetical protein
MNGLVCLPTLLALSHDMARMRRRRRRRRRRRARTRTLGAFNLN